MVFGASVFIASGFLDIIFASNLSSSVSSGTHLQAWGESIGIVALGFALIVSAVLVGASKWPSAGVMLGVLASLIAEVLPVGILNTPYSLNIGTIQAPAAAYASFGSILALFIGFPMGMAGSFGGFKSPEKAEIVS